MNLNEILRKAWDEEIEYCRDHIEYFVDTYGHIENKNATGIIVPFRMWKEQREALLSMNEHRLNIVLKARQLGLTWLALHIAAHMMLTKQGCTVIALSKREEEAKEMIRRIVMMFDHMPQLVRREEWYGARLESTTSEVAITFPNGLKSTITAFTASEDAGRSFTANLVILDEWAFQQFADKIWKAAYPTVSSPEGGKVIGLSTIKRGTLFEKLFTTENNGFNKLFIPWYADPKRDEKWYAETKAAIGEDGMSEEFPATIEEALTVPGGSFFPEWKDSTHVTDRLPDEPIQRYVSLDYGLDKLAAYWYAVGRTGRAVIYRELYVSGLIVSEAAKAILNASGNERIDGYYAPPDLWNKNRDTGRSTAEIFADYGIALIKTSNERVQGWLDVKEWIRPIEETNEQTGVKKLTSRLQVLNGAAPNLCRCMKAIQKDEKKPNDCANDPHELTHAPDSVRAFCAGRPQPPEVPTMRDPDMPRSYNEQINDFMSWGTY